MKQIRAAFCVLLLLTILTGVLYPAAVTLLAQALFPHQANGSLIERHGRPVGSEWIGQHFEDAGYFWGRPSATSPPYNGAASGGSNNSVTNPAQLDAVKTRIARYTAHRDHVGPVPVELVTASASGLDPHISPAAAEYQAVRVANQRAISADVVRQLITQHTEGRSFGVLGEPRVNVLRLNLALDSLNRGGGR